MSHPFDSLYDGLEHGKWTFLHSYTNHDNCVSADLEVCAMPARFYRLVVCRASNPHARICLTTGSGERMKKSLNKLVRLFPRG